MSKNFFLVSLVLYTVAGVGQPPVAQRPQTYIDTSFNPPTGVSWKAHTSTDFKKALESANPGDTIVLDAGATYQGNFNLPAKTNPNNKWIYIVGSSLASLPAPGTRVNPATDAAKMPKIVTPNSVDTIELLSGANHYRFVGIEFYSASTVGCNPKAVPPVNCFTSGGLISSHAALNNLPDSIFIDRCYIHGQPNIDVHRGVQMIGTNFAIVDSYINEIHMQGTETQAAAGWWGNGPFKIVNNYLSAAGEVVMFGGSGGVNNPTVPSDIEIRNNYFYLPLAWDAPGISLPPNPNNVIKNASSGVNFSPHEPYCSQVPGCTSTGEVLRVIIRNNLFLLGDTTQPGWSRGYGMGMLINPPNATDLVFQHNTVVPPAEPWILRTLGLFRSAHAACLSVDAQCLDCGQRVV